MFRLWTTRVQPCLLQTSSRSLPLIPMSSMQASAALFASSSSTRGRGRPAASKKRRSAKPIGLDFKNANPFASVDDKKTPSFSTLIDMKPFECSVCHKQFRLEGAAKHHMSSQHGGSGEVLRVKEGASSAAPPQPVSAATATPSSFCRRLQQADPSAAARFATMPSGGSSLANNPPFQCTVCDYSSATFTSARQHVRDMHGGWADLIIRNPCLLASRDIDDAKPVVRSGRPAGVAVDGIEVTQSDGATLSLSVRCGVCATPVRIETIVKPGASKPKK